MHSHSSSSGPCLLLLLSGYPLVAVTPAPRFSNRPPFHPSPMADLRSRKSALSAAAEKITPLDSSEQSRIIRDFQLEKMKQDALWKHALAVLYGVGAGMIAMILACALIVGCGGGPPRQSELDGPAEGCTLFNLPRSLLRATGSPSLVFTILLLGLLTLLAWGAYAWALDWARSKARFNASRTLRRAEAAAPWKAEEESKEVQEAREALLAGAGSTQNQPVLPIDEGERARLRWMHCAAHISIVGWMLVSAALVAFHRDAQGLGLLVWLLIVGPLALATLTKLAARWSEELEGEIEQLQKSQYSFHEL